MKLTLYNQCRSGPSHRVRIALAMKGIDYEYVAIDLRAGAQRSDGFRKINAQGFVPALDVDGVVLTQSSAILEWIEESFPAPPLLPADPLARAHVRSMAAVIGSDVQPLNNLRIQACLRDELHAGDAHVRQWVQRWIAEGFDVLEQRIERFGGTFSFGDQPTLADIYLIPQVGMADRQGFDRSSYPRIAAVCTNAARHEAFAAADPARQPDWS
ncbi:MAG: maleylacetoacetate isomerase [Gammaproteobacteria bacterium]|nr:maleylacetoacetate isomerase [Gammaproteobacteria bacterium]